MGNLKGWVPYQEPGERNSFQVSQKQSCKITCAVQIEASTFPELLFALLQTLTRLQICGMIFIKNNLPLHFLKMRFVKFYCPCQRPPLDSIEVANKEHCGPTDPNIFGRFASQSASRSSGFCAFLSVIVGRKSHWEAGAGSSGVQHPAGSGSWDVKGGHLAFITRRSAALAPGIVRRGNPGCLLALLQGRVFCLDAQGSLSFHCVAQCPEIKDNRLVGRGTRGRKGCSL